MTSFGEELRREREVRGIKLSDISETTRINIEFLKALEENRFEDIPGGVLRKSIIKAYAKHLGIDEEKTLTDFMFEMSKRQENESKKTANSNPSRKWWEKLFSSKR